MPQACLQTLIQSWVFLTQVRDSAQLDQALIQLVSTCLEHTTGCKPVMPAVLRLRAVTEQAFASPTQSPALDMSAHTLPAAMLPALRASIEHSEGEYQFWTTEAGTWHFFPLQPTLTHRQSALVFSHPILTEPHIALLKACLDGFYCYANLIVENERDALTGLLNRKTFDQQLNKLLLATNSAQPNPLQYYFAIFDIDGFKRINDNFGHMIGDEVLLLLSRLMRQSFREEDLLFRFGGEEFVGIFSCSQSADIQIKLERFQRTLAETRFPQVGSVTVSIGYAQLALHGLPTLTLEHADMALYYAKEHGRNRICHYESLVACGQLHASVNQGEMELF